MTIEIHQPRLEALIQQRMASGHFQSVEDLLLQTLETALNSQEKPVSKAPQQDLEELPARNDQSGQILRKTFGKSLVDVFAEAREILGGVELDLTRNPSPGRPVDLS